MVLNFIRGGPVTGRFAPTPSGRMHIGNVYAMLGAWLSARSRGDRMLMRIEDVDKPRVAAGADQLMMDDLHWLGLDWDGEPMFQSSALNDTNTLSNACARKVCCTPVSARVPTFAPPRPPTRATASWCTPGTCRPPAARPSRRGPCPFGSRRPAFHPYRHAGIGSGRKATYSA